MIENTNILKKCVVNSNITSKHCTYVYYALHIMCCSGRIEQHLNIDVIVEHVFLMYICILMFISVQTIL